MRLLQFILLYPILTASAATSPLPGELFLNGYTVVPSPREVELEGPGFPVSSEWSLDPGPLEASHIAVRTLLADMKDFHGLTIEQGYREEKVIRLAVQAGTVSAPDEVSEQAYQIETDTSQVEIIGNSEIGLFYGVQTFLQLIECSRQEVCNIPQGTIRDWPSFKLRFLHWDTKHHQDRMVTLKRYLDWAARFKVNMIAYELEDKFSYPSHPVIGAPGAFTPEQLQELVDYGLERFIQIVPNIQSPAHMAYVLKHEEFAHLRADGMNYQACLCDEQAYDLIFSMYQDVIDATRGVDYLFVSTDEVYYAGICKKCEVPYNPENRSLKWVKFANRAHEFLSERGRRMLAWVEYPLLPEHISRLPEDLIDGVLGNNLSFIEAENRRGIRQLVYTSLQGSEFLFPNYWKASGGDFRSRRGRLQSVFSALSEDAWKGNPIGVFGAAWGDSGLHSETFWLGWSTVAQYGWSHGRPAVEQHVSEFFDTYYGIEADQLLEIFQGLQEQARFFQESWDRVISRDRDKGYGNSWGKGIGVIRRDYTLPAPPIPNLPGLDFVPVYSGRYDELFDRADEKEHGAQVLTQKLYNCLLERPRNQYNLEVFLSLAEFARHHCRMLMSLKAIEGNLANAREAAESDQPERAVESMVAAYRVAQSTIRERIQTFRKLEKIWEKSRYPKGQSVGGKDFVHILDDVKDHWADRRSDLSYMIAPEESIELGKWSRELADVIAAYAAQEGVSTDSIVLEEEPEE